jgi:hypothetical protein
MFGPKLGHLTALQQLQKHTEEDNMQFRNNHWLSCMIPESQFQCFFFDKPLWTKTQTFRNCIKGGSSWINDKPEVWCMKLLSTTKVIQQLMVGKRGLSRASHCTTVVVTWRGRGEAGKIQNGFLQNTQMWIALLTAFTVHAVFTARNWQQIHGSVTK